MNVTLLYKHGDYLSAVSGTLGSELRARVSFETPLEDKVSSIVGADNLPLKI